MSEEERQALEKRIEEISGANKVYKLENRRLRKRINKTIEYIERKMIDKKGIVLIPDLLNLLKGEDIKEIPQFEGTLEQLDKLSIRGDKE